MLGWTTHLLLAATLVWITSISKRSIQDVLIIMEHWIRSLLIIRKHLLGWTAASVISSHSPFDYCHIQKQYTA